MPSEVKYSNAKKSYQPAEALVNLMKDLLQHKKKEQKLEERIDAGGMEREQIEAEQDVLDKEKDNLVKERSMSLTNTSFQPWQI